MIRVLTAGSDRVQSRLCRLQNKNAPFFGADTIHGHDPVMGGEPVWLEGTPTEDFFLCANQAPVLSLNSCAILNVAHRKFAGAGCAKLNISAAAGLKSGQLDRRRNFKKANIES